MRIVEYLVNYAKERDEKIKDIYIGTTWTCVLSKFCGTASTDPLSSHVNVRGFGHLHEKNISELSEYLFSFNLLEASVGLASINSIITPTYNTNYNGLDLALELSTNKNVVMVGYFGYYPKLNEFNKIAKEFTILELNPFLVDPTRRIFPSTAAESIIPKADIVIMTGMTIINKSIDRLIELAKKNGNAYTMIVGPSVPMLKDLLDLGIDILSGIQVVNPNGFIRKITQGCGIISPEKLEYDVRYITLTRI
ncbi:DUF364 domain-containing protein [Acidianus manzaensis]|uniref:Heavy-metal chelation domain-containing protein n=1 Tax=Acidianus manzaensis TaxID=282676 RepID=A0A1W6JYC0_9CREN|nr:DUF364 domain-containing protein [Acidianus manzaensis]ARM75311.1 hypothetical protein B6F84_04195 [Acidianus manzaensis]